MAIALREINQHASKPLISGLVRRVSSAFYGIRQLALAREDRKELKKALSTEWDNKKQQGLKDIENENLEGVIKALEALNQTEKRMKQNNQKIAEENARK